MSNGLSMGVGVGKHFCRPFGGRTRCFKSGQMPPDSEFALKFDQRKAAACVITKGRHYLVSLHPNPSRPVPPALSFA